MKNVLIVGVAGGVGSALGVALSMRGDGVIGSVLNAAEAVAAKTRIAGLRRTVTVDLSDPEGAAMALSDVVTQMERLDAVVVCAALSPIGPMETTKLAVARRTFEVNCLGALAVYQACLPALRRSTGRIVFISSMAGKAGMPFIGAYVGSKFALEGMADVMRREAAPQGVSVSLIEPGGIRTWMVAVQLREVAEGIAELTGEARERYLYLYQRFQALASDSYEHSASSPEAVAAAVIEALDAVEPASRYVVGPDAQAMMDMAKNLPDAALDTAFAKMFAPPA